MTCRKHKYKDRVETLITLADLQRKDREKSIPMSDMQEVAPYRTEVEVLAPGAFAVISGEPFPRDWEMYQTLSIVLEEEGRYEVFWGDDEIRVNKLEA